MKVKHRIRIVEVVTIVFGTALIVFLVKSCGSESVAAIDKLDESNWKPHIVAEEPDTLSAYDKQIDKAENALKQSEANRESFYKQKMKTTYVSLWALEEARKKIYPDRSFASSSSMISMYQLRQLADQAVILEELKILKGTKNKI